MRSEHEKTIRTKKSSERKNYRSERIASDGQTIQRCISSSATDTVIQSMPPATTVNRQNPSRLNRMTMPTLDSMNRRQPPSPQSLLQPQPHTKPKLPPPAIASPSRRKNQKQERRRFSLLLTNITISNANNNGGRGAAAGNHHHSFITRVKNLMLVSIGPILLMRWLSSGQMTTNNTVFVRDYNNSNHNWRINQQQIISASLDDEEVVEVVEREDIIAENNSNNDDLITNKSNLTADEYLSPPNNIRSFNYIGDLDPTIPQPWPKEELDWWKMHRKLVKDVLDSDASLPTLLSVDEEGGEEEEENDTLSRREQQYYYLPQLIFYGDSITEGWAGTSFGNIPGSHRMWNAVNNEDEQIRQLFENTFGTKSAWGRRALKQPLKLGISGSRTNDLLWRIKNGEFPTSQLLMKIDVDDNEGGRRRATPYAPISSSFPLTNLERIYIVLIGTNNLGGGMLPAQTVVGMDAIGRTLLGLHTETFSLTTTPAAIVFSELLPRRDDHRAVNMCPPRCKNITTMEPYQSFMPAIDEVNRALPRVVDGWRRDFPKSRIVLLSSSRGDDDHLVAGNGSDGKEEKHDDVRTDSISINQYQHKINCGREMFSFDEEDDEEFDRYMPDRLHPNLEGYELWSRCLKKGLEAVMMDRTIHLEQR